MSSMNPHRLKSEWSQAPDPWQNAVWTTGRWAMAIDSGAFIAMHFFTDLARGMEWDDIGAHMLVVACANLLFDWAYDEGGLTLAAAGH
jgi:hypothetical protein